MLPYKDLCFHLDRIIKMCYTVKRKENVRTCLRRVFPDNLNLIPFRLRIRREGQPCVVSLGVDEEADQLLQASVV